MILDIFWVLVVIACFLIWFGFPKIRVFSIVGFAILFLLSAWIIFYSYTGYPTGLEYRSGVSVLTNGSTQTVTYVYSTYNDVTTFWVGFLLSIVSALGMLLVAIYEEKK